MDIKEKLKTTLLIPKSLKDKLLMMDKWPEEIKIILEEIFKKYGNKENKVKTSIKLIIANTYVKTLKDIEKNTKVKESEELKLIEEKLSKL